VTIKNCVATKFGGAGFVTEDGSEVGNAFSGNLAFNNKPVNRQFPVDVHQGFQGVGFWFKSMVQFIDDNVAVDNGKGFQSAITAPNVRGVPEPGQRTSVPQMIYQSSPGGPMDGIVTVFQTNLSGKRNRFIGNVQVGLENWGSVPQLFTYTPPTAYRLHALPVQWEDCLFAFNGKQYGYKEVVHSFTQCCVLYTNCAFVSRLGNIGSSNSLDYHRVIYFDDCEFSGMKTGLMAGRGTVVRNCMFDCSVGIKFNDQVSQQYKFGVTLENNTSTGLLFELAGPVYTSIDQIKQHEVTLDDVYSNVTKYRTGMLEKSIQMQQNVNE